MTKCGTTSCRLTFGQMCPLIGEAMGQINIFLSLQVRLTFGQMSSPIGEALGQVDIFVRSLGQVDLWSDVPPKVSLRVFGSG